MSKQYVDDVLALIRPFYEEVQAHIETMKVGEKVPATKLAERIAEKHGMTGPQLYPTLKFFFDNCPELEVRRGAHGGLFKMALKTDDAVQVDPTAQVVEDNTNK